MITIQTTNKDESEKWYLSPSNKNSEKKKRRRRVVRFSPRCYIKDTISLNEMTEEEITNTWIQEDEEDRIRQRCRELIAVTEDDCSTSTLYCLRGLESHTKDGKI